MAAAGGGKIRTRRYHIASKPYAKGKQQQPGLITRVTDTVKSIVPSWLQKYFKNGELTAGEEARVEVEQNNVVPPPNGSEDPAQLQDGRNSPEPSTSNAEPSTSKASLNFQDVLSRPPLNRSHLQFPTQDGSPALGGSNFLFSQPSTSAASFPASPFAVSSNFSLVKEIKDSSSQHEDDNISTTSGFSSRASDKDVPTSKTAPLLWSPETDRTHSGSQLGQTTLKKPAFNLSVFGTSSSLVMNNSVLNSSQLGDSPFYPGKTTYGGAAAARSARARPGTPYHAPVRRQIKAKPAGAQPCGVTSATARRILQSLERMSSPLADAKRIPSTVSSPLSTSLNNSDQDISSFQSKKKKVEPALPPVQKLVIPAAASVASNRSMSFRPSLTPGSVSRVAEKSNKETPVKLPQRQDAPAPPPSTSGLSYPLSSTPTTSSTGTGGGKMKRERSIRPSSKKADDEVPEAPDLPAISLPLNNSPLPTFSFSTPPPTSTLKPNNKPSTLLPKEPAVTKVPTVPTTPELPFTFSTPIVKATAASPPSFSPSTGFTFSAPTMKTTPSASNGKPAPAAVAVKAAASERKEEFEGPFKPAKELKQGSVLDILKGPGFASPARSSPVSELRPASESSSSAGNKFKSSLGTWNSEPSKESSSKSDSKPAKAPAASLNTLFARPAGTWDCDTCLVQNKPDVVKCIACDTAKPGTGVKPALTLPPPSEASSVGAPSSCATTSTSSSTTSGLLGFGDKFKKPEGAWDCDVCMVQNKAQDSKCVACLTAKPGSAAPSSQAPAAPKTVSTAPLLGFGDKFKKPEGSWDCDVCCVQNKAEDQQCVACQTSKPGAKVESKGFVSSFGTQSSSTDSSSSAFKFGTGSSNATSVGLKFGGSFANSSNSLDFKMGNTSDSTSSSGGFKFGTSSADSTGGFKFGGASVDSTSTSTSSSEGFKFGGSSDGFKFGAASASTNAEEKDETAKSSTGFKFGGSGGVTFGSTAASASTTVTGGFSFEQPKPKDPLANTASSSLEFDTSAPIAKSEKAGPPSTGVSVSSATATNTNPVFGQKPVSSLFDEPAAKEPALATSFRFGKPEEKKDAAPPTTGFVFNAAKEADQPTPSLGFSFSKPEPPKEVPKPAFTFGKPAEPAEASKPTFGFGQSAADASSTKPAFGFMVNSSSTPASSSPAPSLFGAQSSSTIAPTPAPSNNFMFGQNSSSDAPPAKTFMFGQQQDSQPAAAAPPAPAAAAPAPAQPFLFGSTTNSTGFAFGGAATATPASAAPAPSAAPSPLVFTSATAVTGFGSAQAPAFGQGSSQPAAPAFGSPAPSFSTTNSASPAFGAKPSPAPVFGQQPSATPVFGSSAPSAGQGGFQFGGASAFGTPNRNSGVFTFGGGAGNAANSAPSPAMSAQPVATGGGFSFSQSPAFNIGSTKSVSSAAPTAQHAISGRKIKTAVRRRK